MIDPAKIIKAITDELARQAEHEDATSVAYQSCYAEPGSTEWTFDGTFDMAPVARAVAAALETPRELPVAFTYTGDGSASRSFFGTSLYTGTGEPPSAYEWSGGLIWNKKRGEPDDEIVQAPPAPPPEPEPPRPPETEVERLRRELAEAQYELSWLRSGGEQMGR